jgi:hypothetical protein
LEPIAERNRKREALKGQGRDANVRSMLFHGAMMMMMMMIQSAPVDVFLEYGTCAMHLENF